MSLTRLEISAFRNLVEVVAEPGCRFNLFYGQNGSGKTSLLEAIYYLGLARSFRTHLNNRIINNLHDRFSVFGRVQQETRATPIGIERFRDGVSRIRIAGEDVVSVTELAKIIPLQFMNSEAHRLLVGGPKYRRQFLDWGVFHVEHSFFPLWQRAHRALRQRNAALRTMPIDQIRLWNQELVVAADALHALRTRYMEQFEAFFSAGLQDLLQSPDVSITYQRGWPRERNLLEVLEESLARDMQLGYTQFGPQRADLTLRVGNTPAHEMLSQGQQKLVVYSLRLAQGLMLQQVTGKKCIYLLDDLPAELDQNKRALVANKLMSLNTQIFITGIEKNDLLPLFPREDIKLFHVEHGEVGDI